MDFAEDSRHRLCKSHTRHPRHLGHRRMDVGRNRRGGIDRRRIKAALAWRECHRHCAGLRLRPPPRRIVGEALADGLRQHVVLATKVAAPMA